MFVLLLFVGFGVVICFAKALALAVCLGAGAFLMSVFPFGVCEGDLLVPEDPLGDLLRRRPRKRDVSTRDFDSSALSVFFSVT